MAALHPMTRFLFRWSAKQKAFAPNSLGVRLPVDGGSLSVDNFDCTKTKEISVTLPWPAWLCRPDGQLCLASALAISDEVSTFGMAAWDKLLRHIENLFNERVSDGLRRGDGGHSSFDATSLSVVPHLGAGAERDESAKRVPDF